VKHINELKNFGLGKKCLIVGGGHSLNEFKWDKIDGMYVICTNDHLSQMAYMIIYYDKRMRDYFKKHTIADETILIGYKNDKVDYTIPRCNFYYNNNDMVFGDTGFHALQFADKIFNFSKIYLIGFDYDTKGESYHHNEEVSNNKRFKDFTSYNIGKVLKMYNQYKEKGKVCQMKWNNEIYNCNKKSKLTLFPFALPY
jgi:hypothetical protein